MRFILPLTLLLTGCAFKERIVYQDVLVPTKCKVKETKRPVKHENETELTYLKKILIYTEVLEKDLRYCTGRDNDATIIELEP